MLRVFFQCLSGQTHAMMATILILAAGAIPCLSLGQGQGQEQQSPNRPQIQDKYQYRGQAARKLKNSADAIAEADNADNADKKNIAPENLERELSYKIDEGEGLRGKSQGRTLASEEKGPRDISQNGRAPSSIDQDQGQGGHKQTDGIPMWPWKSPAKAAP